MVIHLAMDRRPVIKWGRETGAYLMFARYLTRGVWWCLAAAFVTLVMFLPDFGAVGRSDGVRTDVDGNVWSP
jgi:hypothetical protein